MHDQGLHLPEGLVGLEITDKILNDLRTVPNGADGPDDPRVVIDSIGIGLDVEQLEQLACISNVVLEVSLVTSVFSLR